MLLTARRVKHENDSIGPGGHAIVAPRAISASVATLPVFLAISSKQALGKDGHVDDPGQGAGTTHGNNVKKAERLHLRVFL